MKTSINVPDWLHDEVDGLCPGMAFGEQVRDALLLALPAWRKAAAQSPIEIELRAKLRMAEANADQARREAAAEVSAAKARQRRSAPAKREPAKRPARQTPAAPASPTRGRSGSTPTRRK